MGNRICVNKKEKKKIEEMIETTCEVVSTNDNVKGVEEILFKLPNVKDPLIGTPKEVQTELDRLAIKLRNNQCSEKENQYMFDKIHLYMHGFLINVALKQFPYIKGLQTVDIYQESLIALRFKAIPGFKKGKGMSFLNFAKMCIRRHLITILNTSNTRLKDQSINKSVSIDSHFTSGNSDETNTFANVLPDKSDSADKKMESSEAYKVTLDNLYKNLSLFEREVLDEYLTSSSYSEIAKDLSKRLKKRHPTKSIDNALVRIRHKAQKLKENSKTEDIPLFLL